MRSVQVPKSGGPDVMRVIHWPSPECGPGHLRVEVLAGEPEQVAGQRRVAVRGHPEEVVPVVADLLGVHVHGVAERVGHPIPGHHAGVDRQDVLVHLDPGRLAERRPVVRQ